MADNGITKEDIINHIEMCPINYAMNKLGGKWKPLILHRIQVGIYDFDSLQKAIPTISKQVLQNQLRELEFDGLIERDILSDHGIKLAYLLTELGESIIPIIDKLSEWGANRMRQESLN